MRSRIKLSFFLVFLVILSCESNSELVGKWRGTVVIVNVEYELNEDNSFVVSSYSSNNVLIGGGKGQYQLEDDTIIFTYNKFYEYNSKLKEGLWIDDNRVLSFDFKIEDGKLLLTEVNENFTIILNK